MSVSAREHAELGHDHAAKAEYDKALAAFTEAIRLGLRTSQVYISRGQAAAAMGQQDQALADFTEALRLDPHAPAPWYYRGLIHLERAEHDRAIADLTESIRLYPTFAGSYYHRATAFVATEDYDRTIADFLQAIRLDPSQAYPCSQWLQVLREHLRIVPGGPWEGECDRAIAECTEVLRHKTQDAGAYSCRGFAWLAKGDPDQALADFTEAARLDSTSALALLNLGIALQQGVRSPDIIDLRTCAEVTPLPNCQIADDAEPKETSAYWKHAGAEVGWMQVGKFACKFASSFFLAENEGFFLRKNVGADDLPAFQFLSWTEGVLATLPAPSAFGLDLHGTQVTDAGLEELARFQTLQALNLGGTAVTNAGLRWLAALKTLQTLNLDRTAVTDAGLKELADLKNLQVLSLAGTQVTGVGLQELTGLKNLQHLNLASTPVRDVGLKALAGLQSLQHLNLTGAPVTDAGLKALAGLQSLQALGLSDTRLTDAGLTELAGLKNLQALNLDHTVVTDVGLKELAELRNLQTLDLNFTQVTDAGLKELAGLHSLQWLGLRYTGATDAGVEGLREHCPHCRFGEVGYQLAPWKKNRLRSPPAKEGPPQRLPEEISPEPQIKAGMSDDILASQTTAFTVAFPHDLAAMEDLPSDAEGSGLRPIDIGTDPYLARVAMLTLPSIEQTGQFAHHVLGAHSWYKHVPNYSAQSRLVFYLDPDAGKQRCYHGEKHDGQFDLEEIVDPSQCWHYSMMLTAEYLQRFGHWSFWIVHPRRAEIEAEAEPEPSIRLANEHRTAVSGTVTQYCSCPATYLLSRSQAIAATLMRSRAFFEQARMDHGA
jgi:tetratricopeptide (TPR) repeat protein